MADTIDFVVVSGTRYNVMGEVRDHVPNRQNLIMIQRPKGAKIYVARRLPDSPLYGERRAQILCPAGFY